MAYMLDELKNLKLYQGKFYYPLNTVDRKRGSIVYLLTPNFGASMKLMNHDMADQNIKYFKSYYLEKNIDLESKNLLENGIMINGEVEDLSILQEMRSAQSEYFNESVVYSRDKNRIVKTFLSPKVDSILEETNYIPIMKKVLYNYRIKNQKEVLLLYEKVKTEVPYIEQTYANPLLYKNFNVFYDFSYYTTSFYKHYPAGFQSDRGIDLLGHYIASYIQNKVFAHYQTRCIVIPIEPWTQNINDPLNYLNHINPLSMIARFMKRKPDLLQKVFGEEIVLLFLSEQGYFTMNTKFISIKDYAMFSSLITGMARKAKMQAEILSGDSKKSIMVQLADKLENEGKITLTNLSGGTKKMTKEELDELGLLDDPLATDDEEVKKAALVNKLEKIADKSTDIKDAEKQLENPNEKDSEWLKDVLLDIQSTDGPQLMNKARIARRDQARKDILGKEVAGKTIKQLLEDFKKNEDIPEESIPIDTIDDSWHHLHFTNFNKVYDLKPDIVAMFMHFQDVTHPMNVVSIKAENTSTSEDFKETWTCVYEDAETGKRHTMTLDIPTLIGNRFMKLRGNEKVLIGQLMLLPITKTGDDTVQIVSNYNKIFVRRKSPNGLSKSTPIINKLCKALDKYSGHEFKVVPGDNRKICLKYELPMEFVDIASLYAKIIFKDGSYISFNMDELTKIPFENSMLKKEDQKLPLELLNKKYLGVYVARGKRIPLKDDEPLDLHILDTIRSHDASGKFDTLYQSCAVSKRLMYSDASIMSTNIPVAVVLAYNIGLQKLLNKLEVQYEFSEKRPGKDKTYIKFSDGYLSYHDTTARQNMLLNGLMECDFSDYSIKDINGKDMWLDMLDNFGGRIKADGLDNFYDCMFDPITVEICHRVNMPDNYVDGLIYANDLLVDNRYIKHADITGNRLRTNEVIVGHLYLVLSKAFGTYRNMIKRQKSSATFTAKKDAVIDSILNHDQTSSDLSTLTPLLEAEAAGKVTFKGLSGMNSDRAFSLDKRVYDESMIGILGLSTGFASNVGINRQLAIDANVVNKRGFMKTRNTKDLDNTKTFTVLEALSPMAVNHDDPIRTCMAFTQTVQHQMKVKKSLPNLITTGCDEALPYITSDKFAYKFKGKRGVVVECTEDYIVYQDLDTKEYDYIDTREIVQKNSDGGFYITTRLTPNVKKGDKLFYNQILAYDKESYSTAVGQKGNNQALSYNIGTLAKVAIMDTDLGYEDSCVVDNTISEALTTNFLVQKDVNLERNTNVYNMVKIGDQVEEGDSLMVYQNAFDEKEANELLASLSKDNEALSDLGRRPIHAKSTGVIQDIKVYRTCELDVLSPTLQEVCKKYDARINKYKAVMRKYKIDKEYILESTGKLAMEGKLKATEGVKIEFYIKVTDKFGIGDKLVFSQALKGVNSSIVPVGEEAYTDFRPNEHINAFLTVDGVMARMVTSANSTGLLNKILIELARQCQEDLGIKWRPIQDILADER